MEIVHLLFLLKNSYITKQNWSNAYANYQCIEWESVQSFEYSGEISYKSYKICIPFELHL